MKKYAKQFIVILCIASVLLALAAILRSESNNLSRTIEKAWDVQLPDGYEVEYRAATSEKMEEGGLRVHILLYADSDGLDTMLPWVPCTQPTGAAQNGAEAATEIFTALGVPGGEWPDLENAGMWYAQDGQGAEILILHEEGGLRVYILESFS